MAVKTEDAKSFKQYIEDTVKKTGLTEAQVVEQTFLSGLPIFVVEETESVGEAKILDLSQVSPWVGDSAKKPQTTTRELISKYRELAEKFAPVKAGIVWQRMFISGVGFLTTIKDPEDKVQVRNKEEIDSWNAKVYQDYYTRGLDKIIHGAMVKTMLVDGISAAEVVYEIEMKFDQYAVESERETRKDGTIFVDYTVDHEAVDWAKHKGIQRLKVIDDAVNRLEPIRDDKSFQVKYWILDKGQVTQTLLLPEQIFILSNDAEGTSLIGESEVAGCATIAILLNNILEAIGVNFTRWGNKRYYFIMGTPERPWSPAHVTNFLKDTKDMVTKNKLGVPVPAGFDFKEIGGEIFEGRDVIDTMMSIIASGMQYPKEFLESPRTQASDKSWMAWLVKISGKQNQIRRSVEQQLWEKHLFCRFGKNYKVKKKGVSPDKQEDRTQFVPNMRWKITGQWNMKEKIEILRGLLNVSNPLSPMLKLEVEKDLAESLGYSSIPFPTQEELEKELEEAEQQDQKEKELKMRGMTEEQREKRQVEGTSRPIVPTGEKPPEPKHVGDTRKPRKGV